MKPARRAILLSVTIPASLIMVLAAKPPQPVAKSYKMYVGTYTRGRNVTSKGIYAYRFQPSTGQLTALGLAAETASPSFLAIHPNHKFLYAINEINSFQGQRAGSVSAFSIDASTAKLTPLNQVSSRGPGPAHVAVDKTGKTVVAANYSGGSLAAFPVGQDGSLGEATSFFQAEGKGVDPARQEGPHAHEAVVSPDNRFVLVPDLGRDKVLIFRLDADKAVLTPGDPAEVNISPAGSGPRHLAFHPNGRFAYLLNEMGSSLMAFVYDSKTGGLRQFQTISALPKDFTGKSNAAEVEVHPNGKFLYASNRGHDSIAVFAIDGRSGKLSPVEYVPTQGGMPRNFAIDPSGAYLLVADQSANIIVVFRIDQQTGKLTPTGQKLDVSAPSCIVFVPEG